MEIAHHLDGSQNLRGAWDLVLFDGEELVYGQGNDQLGDYFLGSKEFARDYADRVEQKPQPRRYAEGGLVLDMVGGRKLTIQQEPNSLDLAPTLVREVWGVARQLRATGFRTRVGRAVLDDHSAPQQRGDPHDRHH